MTPLTILAGFLGAGKTTLLNRLLAQGFGGERTALVVNDFGAIAVDQRLIEHRGENVIAMRNGCICCSLAGDLVQGLCKLLERDPPPERILMETSGVTRVPQLRMVLEAPEIASRIELLHLIAVVDASRYTLIRQAILVVDEQLKAANVILLNRCDLVSPDQREACVSILNDLNPHARIIPTEFCRVDPKALFGAPVDAAPKQSASSNKETWHSACVRLPPHPDLDLLVEILSGLPDWIYRIKGWVGRADGLRHVERAGGDVRISDCPLGRVPQEELNAIMAIADRPLARELEKAFRKIKGARIEEATHASHER